MQVDLRVFRVHIKDLPWDGELSAGAQVQAAADRVAQRVGAKWERPREQIGGQAEDLARHWQFVPV